MPDFYFQGKIYYNPVQLVMEKIGGTWKAPILYRLKSGKLRYGELKSDLPRISDRILSLQLKELESTGLIERKLYPTIPPRTEYRLTSNGKKMVKLIEIIKRYGMAWMETEQMKGRVKKKKSKCFPTL